MIKVTKLIYFYSMSAIDPELFGVKSEAVFNNILFVSQTPHIWKVAQCRKVFRFGSAASQ